MSSLTWLDFSDAERRRALQVVELLGRPETRDELGLGAIRDAFADALFPGMSTVQRRARYFLFVPWIFREAEGQFSGRADGLEQTRRQELRLIEVLLQGEDRDGVIGSRARKNLRQLASTIYWQGLARWGIRTVDGTREQWARSVRRSQEAAFDDDGQRNPRESTWWDPDLVEPPGDWQNSATLGLEPSEAHYLRDRIRETCSDSLLAVLAERDSPWAEVELPWQLDVPELGHRERNREREILRYAQCFSEIMHGAALIYNHQLAIESQVEGDNDSQLSEQYRTELRDWAGAEERSDRRDFAVSDMWALLGDLRSRHTDRTRLFVEDWIALAAKPDQAIESKAAVELIRERELKIKGPKARLTFDAARETWRGAAGAGQLTYRWNSAQRQLLDIVSAAE